MHSLRRIMSLLALAVLAGCSGIKPYASVAPVNLHVHTVVDSGSKLTNTIADVDIFRVDAQCQIDYQGRIFLDKPDVHAGIPVEQALYVEVIFSSSGFLSSGISSIRYDTLLTPRAGYEYTARVNYVRSIFEVVIQETRRGSTSSRVLERRRLNTCKKSLADNKREGQA